MKRPTTALGQAVRSARVQRGLTQTDLAAVLGITDQALHNIEVGVTPSPRWNVMRQLAATLGLSLDALVRSDPARPAELPLLELRA